MTVFQPKERHQCQQALLAAFDAAQAHFERTDRSSLAVKRKTGGESKASQVVTDVDLTVEQSIRETLQSVSDDLSLAWLGEESSDEFANLSTHPRFAAPAFWCVDPLDGTLAFIEGGDGYATAIALVAQNGTVVLGGVLHPPTGQRWLTWQQGDRPKLAMAKETLTFYTDASFFNQPTFAPFMQQLTGFAKTQGYQRVQLVSDRGAVMNAVSVLESPHAFYLKLPKVRRGGGALWDFAATAGLFAAADKPCTDAFGQALSFNASTSLYMNRSGVVFASDWSLHSALLEFIAPWLEIESE